MKLRCAILLALGFRLLTAADPVITKINYVYILPMGGGLDQHLANRLVASGRYRVVTDPNMAEALLSEQIGEAFEAKLEELYPPPPPPEPPKTDDKDKDKKKKTDEGPDMVSAFGDAAATMRRTSSFSRGKGNVFLVERSSKRVIWSTYIRPRNSTPDEIHRVADAIVDRLDDDAEAIVKRARKDTERATKAAPPAPAPAPAPAPVAAPAKPAPAPAPAK